MSDVQDKSKIINNVIINTDIGVEQKYDIEVDALNITHENETLQNYLNNLDDEREILSNHIQSNYVDEIHNFRYINQEFQYYNNNEWITLLRQNNLCLDDVIGATINSVGNTVTLNWTDPKDIENREDVSIKWNGTLLVRKKGSAPTTYQDGIIICNNTIRNQYSNEYFIDTDLEIGENYYYRFFICQNIEGNYFYIAGTSISVRPQAILIDYPSLVGEYTYNEEIQTARWDGYNEDTMILTGVKEARNAGTYTATFIPKPGYAWRETKEATEWNKNWIIQPIKVSFPTINQTSFIYNDGVTITPIFNYNEEYIRISGGVQTAITAGSYETKFSLYKNTEQYVNYVWNNNISEEYSIFWSITPKEIDKPLITNVDNHIYNGEEQEVIIIYTPQENSRYISIEGTTKAINAGEYSITVSLKDNKNYKWYGIDSSASYTETWTINKLTIKIPILNSNEYRYIPNTTQSPVNDIDYGSEDDKELAQKWVILTGQLSAKNVQSNPYVITASLKDKNSCQWVNRNTGEIIIGTENQLINWKIIPALISKPRLDTTTVLIFNTYDQQPSLINFDENYMIKMSDSDISARNVGSYILKIALKDIQNCTWEEDNSTNPVSISWSINTRILNKPKLENSSYIYNGDIYTPTYMTNYEFNSTYMQMESGSYPSAQNAGSYVIKIGIKEPNNCRWTEGNPSDIVLCNWIINKATIENMPTLSDPSGVYSGISKNINVTNFNPNLMVREGTFSATDVGTYTAIIKLKDSLNYQWNNQTTNNIVRTWRITKDTNNIFLNENPIKMKPYEQTSIPIRIEYDNRLDINGARFSGNYYYSSSSSRLTLMGKYYGQGIIGLTSMSSNNYDSETVDLIINIQDNEEEVLTFSAKDNLPFTLSMNDKNKTWDGEILYSNNLMNWTQWDGKTEIAALQSQKIYLKGNGNTYIKNNFVLNGSSNEIKCEGSLTKLVEAESMSSYCFQNLFKGCTKLVQAPILSATVLTEGCYQSMFEECTGLIQAPNLPATTLAKGCYQSMFKGCIKLKEIPTLSATTLVDYCYSNMFKGCTGLIYRPVLSAMKLANYCYQSMFEGCTGFIQSAVPALPATELANYCYSSMFKDCVHMIKSPTLPATTLTEGCYQSMFEGCTELEETPKLKALSLTPFCYQKMFKNCSSINQVPELISNHFYDYCCNEMFYGCTSIKLSKAIGYRNYRIPYRIPMIGRGYASSTSKALEDMFTKTGGSWAGTPQVNEVYFLTEKCQRYFDEDYFTVFAPKLRKVVININLSAIPNFENKNFEYSTDGYNWHTCNGKIETFTDYGFYLRGNISSFNISVDETAIKITTDNVSYPPYCIGSFKTLLNRNNNKIYLKKNTIFHNFFSESTFVTAPDIPGTIYDIDTKELTGDISFYRMFSLCRKLKISPRIEHYQMPDTRNYYFRGLYESMFSTCTELRVVPNLGNAVDNNCKIDHASTYDYMFYNCTNLLVEVRIDSGTEKVPYKFFSNGSGLSSQRREGMIGGTKSNNESIGLRNPITGTDQLFTNYPPME